MHTPDFQRPQIAHTLITLFFYYYWCYCFHLKHEMWILLSRTFFWGKIFQYLQAHCTRIKFFFSESSSLLDNMSFYYDDFFFKEFFIKQKHSSEISKTGQYFHMCTQSFRFSWCLVTRLCLTLLWPFVCLWDLSGKNTGLVCHFCLHLFINH